MNTSEPFPVFDGCFSDLNQFILDLVHGYEAGSIHAWGDLEQKVNAYFIPQRMEQIESRVPGWQMMASYSGGITLVHVMCVFLGLFMLPEFQHLSPTQQQMAKWTILFHDVAKAHRRGKKDTMHAFCSGVQTANILPGLGFSTTEEYQQKISPWSEFTAEAFTTKGDEASLTPDNKKLPEILTGIEHLYGKNTPADLIVKTVLLHISLDVDPLYPTPAPLTDDEIRRYIDPDLLPLLKVMMLADNEGWSLFDPETRTRQRNDTLRAFEAVERLIS